MILPDNEKETRYVVGLAALWVWARQADAAGQIDLGKRRSDEWHAMRAKSEDFGTRGEGLAETSMVRALAFIDRNGEDLAIQEELSSLDHEPTFSATVKFITDEPAKKADPKPIQVRQGVVVGSRPEPAAAVPEETFRNLKESVNVGNITTIPATPDKPAVGHTMPTTESRDGQKQPTKDRFPDTSVRRSTGTSEKQADRSAVVPPAPKPEPVKDDKKPVVVDDNKSNRTARQRVERNRG